MTSMPNSDRELPSPVSGRVDLFSPEGNISDNAETNEKPLMVSDKEPTSEGATQSTLTPNPLSQSVVVASTSPVAQVVNDPSALQSTSTDPEVIEKVWVDKAKKVIESTRNDPRQQTIDLSKVKAEYQKKRFNRDLKIDEKN